MAPAFRTILSVHRPPLIGKPINLGNVSDRPRRFKERCGCLLVEELQFASTASCAVRLQVLPKAQRFSSSRSRAWLVLELLDEAQACCAKVLSAFVPQWMPPL